MEEVKKCLNTLKVTATLKTLPSTLYEMYDRMILKIEPARQSKAIAALTWLLASDHLRIRQLSKAAVIDPTADPPFDVQNRFPDPTWILDVLSCFVTRSSYSPNPSIKIHFTDATPPYGTVTLAHFTVQEYLSSSYILCGPCKNFHITPLSARKHIIRSSIIYINNYFLTINRSLVWQDLVNFLLLFNINNNLEFRRVN
jgi:ankyrin repeat domain-containing protein 50